MAIPQRSRRGTIGSASRHQTASKPKALQAILGSQLRSLRKQRGKTQQEAADHLGWFHNSKISRIETGDIGCSQEDVPKLLELYGVNEIEHKRYLTWARYAGQSWWPDDAKSDDGSALDALLDLAPVQRIRAYEQATVPELLQTPDYARAVLRLANEELPDTKIDRLLEARLKRQAILHRATPPTLWIQVEAPALRRQIGGTTVWRNQIEHLEHTARLPHVALQILSEEANEPARTGHGFTCLRFAECRLPDLVRIRQLTGVVCLDAAQNTDEYLKALDRLSTKSTHRSQTLMRLAELRR